MPNSKGAGLIAALITGPGLITPADLWAASCTLEEQTELFSRVDS